MLDGLRLVSTLAVAVIAVSVPVSAQASPVDRHDLEQALGGTWSEQGSGRSRLVRRADYTPVECAAGLFTGTRRGKAVSFFGSALGGYPRGADIDVLSYPTSSAARQGLRGLRRWVAQCPGPMAECSACDAGYVYQRPLRGARIGRNSYGWWSAAAGGIEAAYLTSIAFVKGRTVIVASYRVFNTRDGSLDRTFVPSVPKARALASRLR